jgi:multisubunit Na+/H+ antiporter MnhF subunit
MDLKELKNVPAAITFIMMIAFLYGSVSLVRVDLILYAVLSYLLTVALVRDSVKKNNNNP